MQALGLTGIDRSRVSRICKELDHVVEAFRSRLLEGTYPYLWMDAVYLKLRHNHRIVGQALVVATGVGAREVVGFALGASEEEVFWLDFLHSLVRRGLQGMQRIRGQGRSQGTLLPNVLDDHVAEDNSVRFLDAFVDSLDPLALGFEHAILKETGRNLELMWLLKRLTPDFKDHC